MDNVKSAITVMRCHQKGCKATKMFTTKEDGTVKKQSFSAGKYFTYEEEAVSCLKELADVLNTLSGKPKNFVIRGQIKEGMADVVRRKCHEPEAAFDSVARPYVMLDIDRFPCPSFFDPASSPEEAVKWVLEDLPEPFRNASCYYKFSSSQSVAYNNQSNKDTISIHLWFWCDRSVQNEEWKRYFKSVNSSVDPALFSPVQIHYTANPIFEGMDDPLPIRSGILEGACDVVAVPKIPEEKKGRTPKRIDQEPIINLENCKKAIELLTPFYKEGHRNRFCGAIAATLYRNGWSPENTASFVLDLADACSDEEADERYKNALCVCDTVDKNLPVQGVPTLKNEFSIRNLDQILSLLGIGKTDALKVVDSLNSKSDVTEIRKALGSLLELSQADQGFYLDEIKRITKCSKPTLKSLLEEVKRENIAFFTTPDWADDTAMFYINSHNGGAHFLRTSDKRYWLYNQRHWEVAPDDFVKQGILDCAREIIATNELNISLSGLINSALNILEGEAYKQNNPLGNANTDTPMVINCRNGELWFDENGDVTLKPHRAESYLRFCLDVDYEPSARSPNFDKAVLEIFANSTDPEGMFRHFMELAGYICQPWRKHALIVLLYGAGSNGKSTLIKVLTRVLGHKMVMSGRINEIGKDKFKIGALEGKLLLFEDDVNANTRLDDGFLKTISEEKLITGEQKYKDPFEFISRAVPVMLANDFPSISDLTDGLRRRMMVIPFDRQFKGQSERRGLFDKLWEEEASGILNQFIAGFSRLKKRENFLEPDDGIKAKNKWITRSNILPSFIEDACNVGSEHKQSLKDMYYEFVRYCEETGAKPVPRQQWFRSRLENLGYEISVSGGQPVVRGIMALSRDFEKH